MLLLRSVVLQLYRTSVHNAIGQFFVLARDVPVAPPVRKATGCRLFLRSPSDWTAPGRKVRDPGT